MLFIFVSCFALLLILNASSFTTTNNWKITLFIERGFRGRISIIFRKPLILFYFPIELKSCESCTK